MYLAHFSCYELRVSGIFLFNLLWPSDVMWCHRSWSASVQLLIVPCLAANQCLKQRWCVVNVTLRHKRKLKFKWKWNIVVEDNAFENVVCKTLAFLYRSVRLTPHELEYEYLIMGASFFKWVKVFSHDFGLKLSSLQCFSNMKQDRRWTPTNPRPTRSINPNMINHVPQQSPLIF